MVRNVLVGVACLLLVGCFRFESSADDTRNWVVVTRPGAVGSTQELYFCTSSRSDGSGPGCQKMTDGATVVVLERR